MSRKTWKWEDVNPLENTYNFFLNQDLVDVTFVCADGEIKAHRLVLCARSDFFNKHFRTGNVLLGRHITKRIMYHFLELIYTGKVSIPNSDVTSFIEVTDVFKVGKLTLVSDSVSSTQNNEISSALDVQIIDDLTLIESPTKIDISDISMEEHSSLSPDLLVNQFPNNGVSLAKKESANKPLQERSKPSTLCLRKNPVALANKTASSVAKNNPDSKRNVRGCRRWNVLDLGDDPTEIDSTKQANDKAKKALDSSSTSQVSAQLNKEVSEAQKRFELFVSTDESDDDQLHKVFKRKKGNNTPKAASSKAKEEISNAQKRIDDDQLPTISKKEIRKKWLDDLNKTSAEVDESPEQKEREQNLKKYEDLLLTATRRQLDQFCCVCNEFYFEIEKHIKLNHRRVPRKKISCEKCSKAFYLKSFLECHVCS